MNWKEIIVTGLLGSVGLIAGWGTGYVGMSQIESLGFADARAEEGSVEQTLSDQQDQVLREPAPAPIQTGNQDLPLLSAKNVLVIDLESGVEIVSKNPDKKALPASTTKIMTALVALDFYQLDEVIEVTKEDRTIGQTMKLVKGEKITVDELLKGLLVASGNDAALALALNHNQGYGGFIDAMNQKAKELGMENTEFKNVSGVESVGHLSTARDLARLAVEALKNDVIAENVRTKSYTAMSVDGKFRHLLRNTNELLGKTDGVMGIKTGWTENAGECLISYVVRGKRKILMVVLGSEDRFEESKSLIEWVYGNFEWKNIEEAY